MFSSVLREAGLVVVEATDGLSALAVMTDVPPDLVVTDIAMPRMDGVELTRTLRGRPAMRQVPIIAVTGEQAVLRARARRGLHRDRQQALCAGRSAGARAAIPGTTPRGATEHHVTLDRPRSPRPSPPRVKKRRTFEREALAYLRQAQDERSW
jgi:CheY-like chemotaxis protein